VDSPAGDFLSGSGFAGIDLTTALRTGFDSPGWMKAPTAQKVPLAAWFTKCASIEKRLPSTVCSLG
jgi:hypothetical protein